MKIKQMSLALAALTMGLASCSKNDSAGNPGDNAPKSVTITLANVTPEVRAGGSAINDGTAVTLGNYYVFFSDGTNLYPAKQENGTDPADQYIDVASGNLSQTFHFLPADVTKVIVIGNVTEGDYSSAATEADLDKLLSLADEQDASSLTLYGFDDALTQSSTDSHGGNLYTAEVNLLPRIARIEVAQFGCTFQSPATYSSFTLNHMAINNYHTQLKGFTNAASGSVNHAPVTEGTVWPFLSDLTTNHAGEWHHDDNLGITLTARDGQTVIDNSKYLVYHFFPSDQPELILSLTGTKGGASEPLYLKAEGFNDEGGSPISQFQAGHIYKVNFTFDESTDLSNPQKCVSVTVTQAQWQVHTVTPDFGN